MSDELVKKALARYIDSFPPEEGRTIEQIVVVTEIAKVLRDEIDRPKEEKDALMAASLLLASREVGTLKQPPPALETYGDHVKKIVEDFLANPDKEYTASADLKQIGLANSVVVMPVMAETMKQLYKSLEGLHGKPEVETAIADMKNVLERSRTELETLMTGDQPRLEARARQAYEALAETAREAVRIYEQAPPAKPASLPKKKKGLTA